jgi:hypothetical protein
MERLDKLRHVRDTLRKEAGIGSALGGAAKGIGGGLMRAAPVVGNLWSAGSALYNLSKGNFADAGLDAAGMLPGIGNMVTAGRVGYDLSKGLQQPQPQAPLAGYNKAAREERTTAFEAGVERFCKEAGFDTDDQSAMFSLIVKTADSAIPITDDAIEDSRGAPGGVAQPGDGGLIERLGEQTSSRTDPTLARQLGQNFGPGVNTLGGAAWSSLKNPLKGAWNGINFLAQRYGSDPFTKGQDIETKRQQDWAAKKDMDNLLRTNPQAWLQRKQVEDERNRPQQNAMQQNQMRQRFQARADRQSNRRAARGMVPGLQPQGAGNLGGTGNLGGGPVGGPAGAPTPPPAPAPSGGPAGWMSGLMNNTPAPGAGPQAGAPPTQAPAPSAPGASGLATGAGGAGSWISGNPEGPTGGGATPPLKMPMPKGIGAVGSLGGPGGAPKSPAVGVPGSGKGV